MLSFLIDECCSLRLVDQALAHGHLATHVNYLGLNGAPDHRLAALAVARGFALVTNNRRDFIRIYARLELHDGLIIIMPSADAEAQPRLFASVLAAIAAAGEDIVNTLVEIDAAGEVTMTPLAES